MHPVIEEMSRIHHPGSIRADVWRRWVRTLRDDVQPLLDAHAACLACEQPSLIGGKPRVKGAA